MISKRTNILNDLIRELYSSTRTYERTNKACKIIHEK